MGDHQAAVGVVGGVPVGEQSADDFVGVPPDVEPAVALVEVERSVGVAVTDELDGLALPALFLAAVVDQRDRRKPGREGAEDAAGFDRGQLVGVADDDELPACRVDARDELGERAGAEHAGLVDDQNGSGLE